MNARLLARQLVPAVLFLAVVTLLVVVFSQTHWDLVSASQSPYPPPGPPPIPTPRPLPTIAPNLSIAEGARQFVSQRHGILKERLILADVFTTTFPLTQQRFWQGLFQDAQSAKPVIYEVLVDENRRAIITDTQEDPQTYWRAEEAAFRKKYQERILGLVAEIEKSSSNDLRIDNGILRHFPLTGRVVWLGKISGAKTQVGVDTSKIELVDIKSLEEKEAKAMLDKYGKLHRDLFYFLQAKPPEQKVKVLLWVSDVDEEWVNQELARRSLP